jgi:hypothetical protein
MARSVLAVNEGRERLAVSRIKLPDDQDEADHQQRDIETKRFAGLSRGGRYARVELTGYFDCGTANVSCPRPINVPKRPFDSEKPGPNRSLR